MPNCAIFETSYIGFFFYKKFILPSKPVPKSECGALKEEHVCIDCPREIGGVFFYLCSEQSLVSISGLGAAEGIAPLSKSPS